MVVQQQIGFAPMPAVAAILSHFDREQLAAFVSVAIELMDVADGDPDEEEGDPDLEPDGTGFGDTSWTEWHTRGRRKDNPGVTTKEGWSLREDDEDDDPAGQYDEDCYTGPQPKGEGAGCQISDSDVCSAGDDRIMSGPVIFNGAYSSYEGPGDETDTECEQMQHDVPVLPVYSAEHNIFTDARVPLSFSNLLTSFRTNGYEVRSADTGAMLVTRHGDGIPAGVPV